MNTEDLSSVHEAIIEAAAEGILVADAETQRFRFANPAICRLLGYEREELLNKSLEDIHPAESVDAVRSVFAAQLRGDMLLGRDIPCLRKDGEVVYADVTSVPLSLGGRRYLAGFFSDVTYRRSIEASLEKSIGDLHEEKAWSSSILDAVDDMITIQGRDFRVLFQNRAMRKAMGDQIGQPCYQAYENREAVCTGCAVARTFEDGKVHRSVRSTHTRQGYGHFEVVSSPVVDGTGQVVAAIESVRNVTELVTAKQRLEQSRGLFEKVLSSLDDAVFVVDGETRTIVECNETCERMFGYPREQLLGSSTRMLHVDEESYRDFVRHGEAFLRDGGLRLEHSLRRRTGEVFPCEVVSRPLEHEGARQQVLVIVRDITARVEAERERQSLQLQLFHAQKMEAIGRITGGVAHDFNNILMSVIGFSEVALSQHRGDAQLNEWLGIIHECGMKAASLTRQLLAFSRRQVLEVRSMSLGETLGSTRKMLQRLIGEDVLFEVRAGETRRIKADPVQVEQVLLNLVINARDAMPSGGTITLRTRDETVAEGAAGASPALGPGDYVVLSVTDTGQGIDDDIKPLLFEPFFTTKEAGKGTGLGLATVYGIVRQHGGDVVVESAPGKGTTFDVFFPATTAEEEETLSEEGDVPRGTETVLVVDDEVELLNLLQIMLASLGYKVLTAAGGGEALRRLDASGERVDLLLTDVVMRGMHGPELAARVRERHPGVKVVFMSGYEREKLSRYGVLDAAALILKKPVTERELAATLRRALDGPAGTPPGS